MSDEHMKYAVIHLLLFSHSLHMNSCTRCRFIYKTAQSFDLTWPPTAHPSGIEVLRMVYVVGRIYVSHSLLYLVLFCLFIRFAVCLLSV